jgi:transposase InsO family protein
MAGHVSKVRLDTVTLGDFRPVMTTSGMCHAPPEPATFPMCYGPEFVSRALLKWIADQGIETALIDPGKPWQNGMGESFNGKFRDECLVSASSAPPRYQLDARLNGPGSNSSRRDLG